MAPAAPQHALLPQPGPPGPQAPQPATQTSPTSWGSPTDDARKRPGGAGTREVHNKLEKNRRAHLKECFDTLKKNIPNVDEKKTSNLSVLRSALRYIQTLKRKEKEYEHEMERLAREKISTQQRLVALRKELSAWMDVTEVERLVRQTAQPEDDQAETSTASEGEEEILEDDLKEENLSEGLLPPASRAPPPQPDPRKTPALVPPVPPAVPAHHHVSLHHQTATPLPQPLPQPLPAQAALSVAAAAPSPAFPHGSAPPLHALLPAPPPPHPLQPTVIARASPASSSSSSSSSSSPHASVIQAVSHVVMAAGVGVTHKPHPHLTHLAPCQPIGHITVHPVAHLTQHLYPPGRHIAHTLGHAHVNGQVTQPANQQAAAAAVGAQVMTTHHHHHHHPQLVGHQTHVLNPVTMVTMSPSFPVGTLKLA